MPDTILGIVKDGVIIPSARLPDGTHVEIHVCATPPELPPELLAELEAWESASSEALESLERLARQMEADEKR